jgi:two-component system cell cycle response regulator CtrA
MIDWEARAKLLDGENEELRGRVRQLEEAIGMAVEPPLVFGLTKSEAIMFGVLLNNRAPRKETFMTAVFSDRIDDPPEQKIIDVWMCKIRKKLKPYGIEIETCWGVGYAMSEACKMRARQLMAA